MKVRNLLLAGLAVAAMTACSNDIDEIVDNGVQTPTEEATMKLYIDFANLGTRADGNATGDKVVGEDVEWNVNGSTITVVLKYPNSNQDIVIKNLSPVTEGAGDAKKYATAAFPVNAGTGVTVYAFINPNNLSIEKGTDLENLTLTTPLALPTSGLDYLTGTNGIAASNAFMMSGKVEGVTIQGGKEDNKASISVDRVAAKLDEGTAVNNSYETTVSYKNTGNDKVNIKLEAFSYSNLTNNTYALNDSKAKSCSASYLQSYFTQGTFPTDSKNDYRWITKADKNITYCLDNYGNNNPTKVHYKGKVFIGEKEISSDFYIRAIYNTTSGTTEYYFFEDLSALQTFYRGDTTIGNITAETSRTDLADLGIKRYTGGTCYYEANINTTLNEATTVSIMRNNWYKLNVSKINEIGAPTPALDPEDKTTKLIVETTINPWTVQINDIIL